MRAELGPGKISGSTLAQVDIHTRSPPDPRTLEAGAWLVNLDHGAVPGPSGPSRGRQMSTNADHCRQVVAVEVAAHSRGEGQEQGDGGRVGLYAGFSISRQAVQPS